MFVKLNFIKTKQFIILTLFFFSYGFAIAQNNSIILNNDVYIILSSNTSLNINQPNSAGIALIGTANGIIKSEGQSNIVNWIINGGTGTYSVPFGIAPTDRIPINYQITAAGSNPGSLKVSTYSTVADNTGYPTVAPAVTNMNATIGGTSTDRSYYATDRFWIFRKTGWLTEPTTKLTLTYKDGENASPNTVTESNLLAEYWDGTTWLPGLVNPLLGNNNSGSNQVNSINASNGNFYTWTLVDKIHPLPVDLISFTIHCTDELKPQLVWQTASETNNMGFIIDKSYDGIHWEYNGFVTGNGNSNSLNSYEYIDYTATSPAYYQLTQVDFDGNQTSKGIFASHCDNSANGSEFGLVVYQDENKEVRTTFNTENSETATLTIYDAIGQIITSEAIQTDRGKNNHVVNYYLFKPSVYFFTYRSKERFESKRFIIEH